MTDGAAFVDAASADRLLAALTAYDALLLAVSGGSDSMALLHLVAGWAARRAGSPHISVATVDHRLRAGSAEEARLVCQVARGLGFAHATLGWNDVKPAAGIQMAARRARYELLARHARTLGARVAVVTAHTANDQAETLLMRLARGSGLDGLAAMRERRPLTPDGAVDIARPLLGVTREALRATLLVLGAAFVDDPSNVDRRFERIRLRDHEATLASLGLDALPIALSARRLARASAALAELADRAWSAAANVHGGLYLTLERARFAAEPCEIRLRLLERALLAFGGGAQPARLSEIETMLSSIDRSTRLGRTLGGCVVSAAATVIRIHREPGRAPIPVLSLRPGQSAVWDRRFRVTVATEASENPDLSIEIRPLGRHGSAVLARQGRDRPCPAQALETLPSFWHCDQLLAVPQLGMHGPGLAPTPAGHVVCKSEFVGHVVKLGHEPGLGD